jgi:hypothetical protein
MLLLVEQDGEPPEQGLSIPPQSISAPVTDRNRTWTLTVVGGLASGSVPTPGYCGQVIAMGRARYGAGLRRLRPAGRALGCGRA